MQLSDTEFFIMRVLWQTDKPLTSKEIMKEEPRLTTDYTRNAIKSLLERKYIETTGLKIKEYQATITEKQYAVKFLAYCEYSRK